jgi:hypothetical protein
VKKYNVMYKVTQEGQLGNFRGEVMASSFTQAARTATPAPDEEWLYVGDIEAPHGVVVRVSTILHIQVSEYVEPAAKAL